MRPKASLRARAGSPAWPMSRSNTCSPGDTEAPCRASKSSLARITQVTQRLLAMAAAIWHHWAIGAPVKRSLTAYDH